MSDSERTGVTERHQHVDETRKEPPVEETVIESSEEESDATSSKEEQTVEAIHVTYENGK